MDPSFLAAPHQPSWKLPNLSIGTKQEPTPSLLLSAWVPFCYWDFRKSLLLVWCTLWPKKKLQWTRKPGSNEDPQRERGRFGLPSPHTNPFEQLAMIVLPRLSLFFQVLHIVSQSEEQVWGFSNRSWKGECFFSSLQAECIKFFGLDPVHIYWMGSLVFVWFGRNWVRNWRPRFIWTHWRCTCFGAELVIA